MRAVKFDQASNATNTPDAPRKRLGHPDEMLTNHQYGYVRTIDPEWSRAERLCALRAAGIPEEHIFHDDLADRDAADAEYRSLLQVLRKGDVLFVASLDQLGRSYDEVITQWQLLTRAKRVDVVVLDIPLLDTRIRPHEMSERYLPDLVSQLLAYVSQRERESIRQRQHEGIIAAQRRGVRFGRPPKPIPPQFETLLAQWKNKEISSRKAAQQLGVAQETFLRWSRKHDEAQQKAQDGETA